MLALVARRLPESVVGRRRQAARLPLVAASQVMALHQEPTLLVASLALGLLSLHGQPTLLVASLAFPLRRSQAIWRD